MRPDAERTPGKNTGGQLARAHGIKSVSLPSGHALCFLRRERDGLMTTPLYPSWIEIPVADLTRALAFYRAVFGLTNTPLYEEELSMRIAVRLPSDKSVRAPGVSLVESPLHTPDGGGIQVNFHMGEHAMLESALKAALAHGGTVINPMVDMGDGVHYVTLRDSEGNPIALSSYESLKGDNP